MLEYLRDQIPVGSPLLGGGGPGTAGNIPEGEDSAEIVMLRFKIEDMTGALVRVL